MFENIYEIILKVTRDCNLNCQYCYLGNKKQYAGERMSFTVFKKLVDQIYLDKHIRNKKKLFGGQLQIVFHGGEPTLLGITKLEKFIKYAKAKLPYVKFGMQTNMILIDRQWIKFFRKYDISPGISIDGNLKKENALRLAGFNFVDKLKLLKKNGVKFGTLMVLSSENIENFSKNLMAFIKKYKISSLKANFVENVFKPEFCYPEISATQMYEHVFLPVMSIFFTQNKLFEANIEHLIDKYINNLLYRESPAKTCTHAICHAKFCGGGNAIVEVEPNGEILFCGRWNKINKVNLMNDLSSFFDPFGLPSYTRVLNLQLQKAAAVRQLGCDTCAAAGICNYGCLAFSYVKYGGKIKIRTELICDYYKKVIKYFNEHYFQIIYIYSMIKSKEILIDRDKVLIDFPTAMMNGVPRKKLLTGLSWQKINKKPYLSIKKKHLKGFL